MIQAPLSRVIHTKRLCLRPFHDNDATTVIAQCNNYNLYKTTLNLPYPYLAEHYYGWLEKHDELFNSNKLYTFAIADLVTNDVIGCISLSNLQTHNRGELAYWIGEKYWNKGFATEAAHALLAFAFEEVKLNRVHALFFAQNPASGKVMEKIGMTYEGTLREYLIKDGIAQDTIFYGILKSDYYDKKNPLA